MVEKTQEQIAHEQTILIEPEPEIVIVDAEEVFPEHQVTPGVEPPKPPQQQYHELAQDQQQYQRVADNSGCGLDLQLCGDHIETGRNVKPGNNVAIKLCGSTHVVLPKYPPIGAHYRFIMVNLCGDARVFVPKGTQVTICRVSLCGNRVLEYDERTNDEQPPQVTVTVVQLCGNIHIADVESLDEYQ